MNKYFRPFVRPFKPILKRVFPSMFKYNTIEYWSKKEGPIYFDYWHKNYENTEIYKLQTDIFMKELKKIEFNSLFDYGCGYGRLLKLIEENFPDKNLAGCDVSKHQIENAYKYLDKNTKCKLHVTGGKEIPYPDNEFDIVMCCDVMIHQTHDLADIVRNEFFRVSKKYILLYECSFTDAEVIEDTKTDGTVGKTCHKHNHFAFFESKGCKVVSRQLVKELGNYLILFEKPGT